MTILNHAATGALVAVAIHNPWIGLPAAFLSHFAIDVIPHWDVFNNNFMMKQVALMVDITFTLGLLLILAVTVDAPRRLIIAGGVLGAIPDLMWAPYLITGNESLLHKKNLLHTTRRLHLRLQIKEFTAGIYVEVTWFILVIYLLYQIHR